MSRRGGNFPDNGFEAWGGYMQAKVAKLEEQFNSRALKEAALSNIFSGISIYVNGYTIPSADELKTLMTQHGGVYHTYQRSEDFIIATNLPDTKVKKMSLARVVRPEWITDSIACEHLLDYRDYLLYKNSRSQKQLNFSVKKRNDDVIESSNLTNNSSNINTTTTSETDDDKSLIKENKESTATSIIFENDIIHPPEKFKSRTDDNVYIQGKEPGPKVVKNNDQPTGTKTAADPNFISEFYNNSRLHHISQLGACFKQHVNDLRESSNFIFPSRTEIKTLMDNLKRSNNLSQIKFEKGKTIMHIDMDCFFVSVGLRNRPDLRGKPVAVTHSKGGQTRPKRPGVDRSTEFNLYRQKQARKISKVTGAPEEDIEFESRVDNITDEDDKYGSMSEIASCSYEARAKGVGNGMFMGAALKLCPDIQAIPYDFEGYKEVAYTLYNTVAQYTLDIEAVSCDEMYVDCTDLLKEMNVNVQDFATALRNEIKLKTGCPCSTGFGGNRLQARLATKKAKPDGQFFLSEDLVEDFIFHINLRDLPGVGRQISQKLETLGHTTCGTLQQLSLPTLKCQLGVKTGAQLFNQCRGRDPNPLTFHTVRKSVSAEVNYGIRFENNDQCVEFLKQLSTEVNSRMLQFKVIGKCITLKLMIRAKDAPVETAKFMGHGFCDVINKSIALNNAINDADTITKEVISIWKKLNVDPKEMRGVGIQVTKLESLQVKQTKGAISKFLSNIKTNKCETVKNVESDIKLERQSETKQDIKIKLNKSDEAPSTPNKSKNLLSPRKKSPIINSIKSPNKRRGRPPKNMKLQLSTSKNLMSKFLNGQNTAKDLPYKNPMLRDSSIKKEIVVKNEKLQSSEKYIVNETPRGLLGLPWEKVREFLRAWLDNGQTPLPCDVSLISAYMQDMVVNKNLEKLYILLKFLNRRTCEIGSNDWLQVYTEIIDQVQNAMVAVYGKKLLI